MHQNIPTRQQHLARACIAMCRPSQGGSCVKSARTPIAQEQQRLRSLQEQPLAQHQGPDELGVYQQPSSRLIRSQPDMTPVTTVDSALLSLLATETAESLHPSLISGAALAVSSLCSQRSVADVHATSS